MYLLFSKQTQITYCHEFCHLIIIIIISHFFGRDISSQQTNCCLPLARFVLARRSLGFQGKATTRARCLESKESDMSERKVDVWRTLIHKTLKSQHSCYPGEPERKLYVYKNVKITCEVQIMVKI